jgi:hypothetical protein
MSSARHDGSVRRGVWHCVWHGVRRGSRRGAQIVSWCETGLASAGGYGPVEVFGSSSMGTTCLGALKWAIWSRQKAMIFDSVASPAPHVDPSLSTTNAQLRTHVHTCTYSQRSEHARSVVCPAAFIAACMTACTAIAWWFSRFDGVARVDVWSRTVSRPTSHVAAQPPMPRAQRDDGRERPAHPRAHARARTRAHTKHTRINTRVRVARTSHTLMACSARRLP